MSNYFVKLPGQEQLQSLPEYELRELWQQGNINEHTLVWRMGMKDWAPINQVQELSSQPPLFAEQTEEQAEQGMVGSTDFSWPYDPKRSATLAIIGLINISINLIMLAWLCGRSIQIAGDDPLAIKNATIQLIEGIPDDILIFCVLLLFSIIPAIYWLLKWLYQSYYNITSFKVAGLRFSPGLCVILSLVPLYGSLLLAIIVKDVYKASKAPEHWQTQEVPLNFTLLFVLSIVGIVMWFIAGTSIEWICISVFFGLAWNVLLGMAIVKISQAQARLLTHKRNLTKDE